MATEVETKSLPANAYMPLAENESYRPIVPAGASEPELSWRSVLWGTFLCVIFTIASAYSGLKVGQVMEAAIPISILAIGLARVYARRSSVLENVIITAIGGCAGAVVAGAIFTLPALYILKLDPRPVQTIFICVAGGCLGVLFLIPLRRYFVREMHGVLPYPEATAITEVLVTGERGGSQAKLLLQATLLSGVYDFFVTTFQVWQETVSFQWIPLVKSLGVKARIAVSFDAISFILGLGYVMGLRSSMILCAGGVMANLVLVPLIFFVGRHMPAAVYPGTVPIGAMTAVQIYRSHVRFIGVGAIATAGIFGIVKSLKIVASSFSIAFKTFKRGEDKDGERTDRDLPMISILAGTVVSALGVAVLLGSLKVSWAVLGLGLLLTLLFAFFFASVAANAIATTARNPVSGMTMLTIIISSVVLLRFGLSGTTGMFFVMAIAGMVCTALSVSGQTITDLKTGYWIGSTPAAQEKVKFLGVTAAAIAAGLTIVMLARTFQFGEAAVGDLRPVLASPQASIMKALVEGFMSRQPVAYVLFGAGAMITIVLEMLGQPSLIFALGMYLPLELNTPALVGGFLSHLLEKRAAARGGQAGRTVRERGVIIASGLMAGGALGGVLGAALRLFPRYREGLIHTPFYDNISVSETVSVLMFVALCGYVWFSSLSRTKGRGMKEPSKLEKLNAVAQAEASGRKVRSLRGSAVFSAILIGMAAAAAGPPLQHAVMCALAILVIVTTILVYIGWRYAPPCAEAAWLISYGAFVLLTLQVAPWVRAVLLAGLVYEVIVAIRVVRAIRLAGRPDCVAEHETIARWLSQLTTESTLPGIIQFAANDSWTDGRVIVRLLQQDMWIVVASLLEKDVTKILTLTVLDAHSARLSSFPERKRLRVGERKFRKVEFTPELTAWASQFAQGSAAV